MATPGEVKRRTLTELRAMRNEMMSAKWKIALERQSIEVRQAAAQKMVEIEQAILMLQNAKLAAIRDDLIARQAELEAGASAFEKARQFLDKFVAIGKLAASVTAVVAHHDYKPPRSHP
jgi:hypothetical protein